MRTLRGIDSRRLHCSGSAVQPMRSKGMKSCCYCWASAQAAVLSKPLDHEGEAVAAAHHEVFARGGARYWIVLEQGREEIKQRSNAMMQKLALFQTDQLTCRAPGTLSHGSLWWGVGAPATLNFYWV